VKIHLRNIPFFDKHMGRNTLSTTALAHKLIADLKPLSEMLPPNERRIVEKFFDVILQQRVRF
jgi:hypothetical protein